MTDIPRNQLRELLLLCTKNVQFVFNGSFYRQVDGVAMGSPLGPVLTDIFLSHIENKLDEAIKDTYLYVRYVDDTFILCKSEDHANELLELFNSIHPNIKFTMEQENCKQLHFLDLNILRKDDTFIRSIHHKNTWTCQYIPFGSFCPIQYKRGLVKTLYSRAYRLCSTETVKSETELLEKTLRDNGYPNSFVRRYSRTKIPSPKVVSVDKKKVMICLPFKGDVLSTQIKQRLGAAIRRTYFAAELLVTHNCRSLLRESNVDKKSADVTSNCIYQFTCTCGSRYVGRTERILSTRISEHVPTNLTLNGPKLPSSAIGRHIIDSGHVIDKTKAFKVITRARNAQLLRFAEASAIRRIKPDLCVQKDFVAHLALPW